MLVFFCVVGIMLILIYNSKIGIKIEEFNKSNYYLKKQKEKIYFVLYIFNKQVFMKEILEEKLKKIYDTNKINMKEVKKIKELKDEIKLIIKKIKLRNLKLDLEIGTNNVIFTTYIITGISTFLSSILPIYIEDNLKNNKYTVKPIFDNEFKYRIHLNCIITIKTVHIIYIIYASFKKRRDEKYVRTSNRSSYESGYE